MKLVAAIVRPLKLDEVREALLAVGVEALTVTEVRGFGRQTGYIELYRDAEYEVELLPKIKIEIAARSEMVAPVIEAIEKSAATAKIGDAKIFGFGLDQVIRIRTGESGEAAL